MLQVFDVLHLDGRSTRTLPFRERRALLEELVLDGLAWRTPATLVGVDRLKFIERVATLGLEGVVAKRLDSIYSPGRRTRVWIKHKLRRDELLAVTGLRRNLGGRVEAVFVARRLPDGSMAGAGSIKLGLRRELVALRWNNASPPPGPAGRPADLVPRRGVSRRVVPWLSDGPVRDAVLRQVLGTDH
jgi:bifunctional non-homologous end joining protein LigD